MRFALAEDLGGAAGCLDLRLGAGGELVSLDGQRLGDLTVAEDLEQVAGLPGEARVEHRFERDFGAGVEDLEVLDVDQREVLLEACVGEPTLGDPAVQRHLTTFEAEARVIARARTLTLVAAAGSLAGAGALATTETLARLVLDPFGSDVVNLH